ncbi:hypothetical protein FBQ82_01155 [Anaerolineae bacterium CFX7]|nr:hypothetical protein [Anaerolineae bacterium CFX7]
MLKKEVISVAPEERESSYISLGLVVVVLLAIGAFLIVTTVPFQTLLGEGSWAMIGAFHGLSAGLLMVVATIGLYLAYRLFTGQIKAFNDLELMSVVVSTLSFITIVFGNWIYIGYRATGGVREYFLANAPELHEIFFEFKEFIALFTFPLAIAAMYILLRYGPDILKRPWLKAAVAILLALVFFYFAVAFGLGAAITKIKPV